MKHIRLLITIFLGTLFLLPFLAPILYHFGYKTPANLIYRIYHFLCHQKSSRSIFIYDEQCAWCARDTFIWGSLFIATAYILYGPKIKSISWKLCLIVMLPMALDGGIQLISTVYSTYFGVQPFYESTNTLRAITGALFGLGLGLFLIPRLRTEIDAPQTNVIE